MTTAISVENLSKSYRLGQIGTGTFTHDLNVWWAKLLGKPNPLLRVGEVDHQNHDGEELWALKDVSFKVDQGDVLGIIGRNGAGKSTLLKILSRVTAPTSGKIKVNGRIASLLEVGTGFHPDLTGRENTYLNGAILGMNRKEIDRKFDEIVDFAEVEKFIDTPVKRYSSGMYVRLAFAVAAHLEPEILVVDEVLAVGDAEFQKKCLGKMGDVAKEGRTVLFVSHNMGAINQLCDNCVLLSKGYLQIKDETTKVIDEYMSHDDSDALSGIIYIDKQGKMDKGKIAKVELYDQNNQLAQFFGIGEPFIAKIFVEFAGMISSVALGIELISPLGVQILNLRSDSQGVNLGPYKSGDQIVFSVQIPGLPLYPGRYYMKPWIAERGGTRFHYVDEGIVIHFMPKGNFQSEKFIQHERGLVIIDCLWNYDLVNG